MSNKNTITLLFLLGIIVNAHSQKQTVWLTYGQSKFLYSPGVEYSYFFTKHIGIQAGVNTYFQNYNANQIVNSSEDYTFNFSDANLSVSSYILSKKKHRLGTSLGVKVYYSPNYRKLTYYHEGGYNIYYDSFILNPVFGVDLGMFYTYKKLSAIFKYDTARGRVRLGAGYTFGKL